MNKQLSVKILLILIMSALCLQLSTSAYGETRRAILVVGNHSDKQMTKSETALKNYLIHYRQKAGQDSSTLPIFVYDFNNPQVRNYCEKKLGIRSSDLLFLGVVTASGRLPEKVHLKVINPQDVEKNAKLVIEKFSRTAATGSIKLASTPSGAKVWMEKIYKGKTPLTIKNLSEGDYTLTLVKEGYIKARKTIYVKNKQTTAVSVDMPSSMGTLAIESDPAGAKVYVDGIYYGETPIDLGRVKPGRRKVQLKKDNANWSGTVTVISGETLEISEKLEVGKVAVATPTPDPTSEPTPKETPVDVTFNPPSNSSSPGEGVAEAFIPKSEVNAIFQVTVSNLEEVSSIKDYYKPKPGYKFVLVYLQQQNVSNEVQIYTGKFSLVDQKNSSFEALDKLSNFWLVVLRPGGIIMGYLVYEIPEDSKPMAVVLNGLNMAPLSVAFK